MNQDKYVFAQLVEFLNNDKFRRLVDKYAGNRYVKHFICWNQLFAMMFGQLNNRESLRDLIVALEAHQGKCYHLELGRDPIAKTTLASANQNRDYRIFEDFAFYMMKGACEKRVTNILDIPGRKYAFDSTTIPLCLATFLWAKFRKEKGRIKVHVLYGIEVQIPAFYTVTTVSKHDSTAMSAINYELNAYYIFNRTYDSLKELYRIHFTGSFFVVRTKSNLKCKFCKWKRRMPKNIFSDAEVKLIGYNPI
ncbi:transposase [Bacteroides salyersiae]